MFLPDAATPAFTARALPTIGLFGFGAFGRLVADVLSDRFEVSVRDPSDASRAAAAARGLSLASPADVASRDIVIIAVPPPAFEACLREIAPHLRDGQLVIDVCSLKMEPAALMQALLPGGVELLATHPMVGPQSAAFGLRGAQVVLCPLRGEAWRRIAAFLRRSLGMQVIVTTPEDHDRQAAMSQGITHLLARALESLGPEPRIRTRSFTLMMEALALVRDDAPEVYDAVTRRNPFVGPLRRRLAEALIREE